MGDIYNKYLKNNILRKSISNPLISINGSGRRPPLCLNFDLYRSNSLYPPEYYKIKKMEEHIKKLQEEKLKQEDQIDALMSYQYNANKKRYNADSNISLNYINPPLYYINNLNDLDYYYNKKAKTERERERRIMKQYGKKIHNLKKLIQKEKMKKKINKSIYDNYHLNIRKDINSFLNIINKNFQQKLESDILLNNNINKIQNKYGKIKNILKDKFLNLENNQKKGFDDIKNEIINQFENIQEIETINNSRINKELIANIKFKKKLENMKRQKELEKLRKNEQLESFENSKLKEEIKFNKLKKELLEQKNKTKKIANAFQRYKYSNPYMYQPNYYKYNKRNKYV